MSKITDIAKTMKTWWNEDDDPFVHRALDEIIRIDQEQAPTIEPKQGEWMPFEYGDNTWHKCSVCGVADKYRGSMERPSGETAKWEYVRNFCPNCGARMKGAGDD